MKINFLTIFFLLLNSIISQYSQMDKQMEQPFRNYVTISRQGLLLPNRIFKRSENPKISIIIPMYNEAKNAKSVIRSIQNQSLQDFEIVCVNDNSNDDTLSVLEQLQEEDPRIIILTNKSNRGVIYNRIFGALKSKGEYVTFIDADDGLCNINILEKSYNIATEEKGEKIDIIHYQSCGAVLDENGEMGNFILITTFNPHNFDKVIKQPEISDNYMQKSNNIAGSGFVFDKIYSRELMKRVADYIGPHIWNQNLIFSDDFLLAYAAMRMTNSIVNIGEVGYWHNFDTQTSTTSNVWQLDGYKLKNPEKSNKKIGDYILITERILELTENEPQFLEFREWSMRKLGEDTFIKAVARSIYYDRYLTICENFIN
jgi:glycosyltransferase involved in cell wall biosynthesis